MGPLIIAALSISASLYAQSAVVEAFGSSSLLLKRTNSSEFLDIHNVTFEVTGQLLLRQTTHIRQVVGDKGVDGTVTLEAWPFPGDLKQKPVYSLSIAGVKGELYDGALFVISRGLEEVEWWSVYKLGSGEHLFDSHVPVVRCGERYVGLNVPPDDTPDARLKRPGTVAVVEFATADLLIRRALITHEDAEQARLLRSYFDSVRKLSLTEGPQLGLRIEINQMPLLIPIERDDLALKGAKLPPKFHVEILNSR